jgi:uridine phosphorylase
MSVPFSESDLVIKDGRIYHLALAPQDISNKIILVGDPDRVPLISSNLFKSVEVDVYHRGLRTHTGVTKQFDKRVSIVTSGMGTPSTEIILSELACLNEIDFIKRIPIEKTDPLTIIRVGTSGGLQPLSETPLGTLIISEYAVGLDNTGLFYEQKSILDPYCLELEQRIEKLILDNMSKKSRFYGKIKPYVSKADPNLVPKLIKICKDNNFNYKSGITISNSGFFANQGRAVLNIKPSLPDLDQLLSSLDTGSSLKIENMEMESSFLFHFCANMNYSSVSICPTVANRYNDKFLEDSSDAVMKASQVAISAL